MYGPQHTGAASVVCASAGLLSVCGMASVGAPSLWKGCVLDEDDWADTVEFLASPMMCDVLLVLRMSKND